MSDSNITGDYVQGNKAARDLLKAQTINIYHHYQAGKVAGPPTAEELQQALATLGHMPVADVPEPADLPYGSYTSYGRNPNFVGRAETLCAVAALFKKGNHTATIGQASTITGYGGVGKSTLAVEFAHRYGRYFAGGVQWVSMAEPAAVEGNIALTGGYHLHADWHNIPLGEQVQLVRRSWESPLPRLLIFDNCEAADLLENYRPKTGGARLLVTSRKGNWPASLARFALDELPRAESILLLHKLAPHLVVGEGAHHIAQALANFPLALHMAGSYLAFLHRNGQPLAPADYVAQLATQPLAHRSLQGLLPGAEPLSANHMAHVAQTFAMSKTQLTMSDEGEGAWRLLGMIAQFAPSVPLPLGVLWGVVAGLEADNVAWAMRLELLVGVGLVEREGQAVRLHPLLVHFVRAETPAEEWEAIGENVAESIQSQVYEINESGYPAPLRPWVAHVLHIAEQAEERGSNWAGVLWNNLGYHYNMEAIELQNRGDLIGAQAAIHDALQIWNKHLGENDPQIALAINSLGSMLKSIGDLVGARAAYERALAIDEATFGSDHPEVARDINNLGSVLKDLGDLVGARSAYERALAIDTAIFGRDHPTVAIRVNNLGSLLYDLGDLTEARAAYERALAIDEAAFGRDHPNVANRVNNLGSVLKDLGDLTGARLAFKRALVIFEQFLPPDHPSIRTVQDNLDSLDE